MSPLRVAVFVFCVISSLAVNTGDFIRYNDLKGQPYNVTYDERSFIINGQRSILLGGSVHYPRFSPAEWPSIMQKALDDGLNHLEVYIFWNLHEPTYDFSGKHVYNYEGRANITQFLQAAKDGGVFINLRIGPYACAEWSFGGVPTWILHDPDVVIRSSNKNWESYMKSFVDEISNQARPFLAKNGGPIVLAQIENEYHGGDHTYVEWCGELAASQNFDIPWVMCNGESANNTINTCNGNNCYNSYVPSHSTKFPGQPLAWTENEGWFEYWGREYDENVTEWDDRSPADMAQSVAIWFGAGAAHHNYYMWMGGNHVSHFAGSSIANYYADGVNYHADGLPHEPKKSHLMRLHNILAKYNKALMDTPKQYGHEQYIIPDGQSIQTNKTWAYVYKANDSSGQELRFLCNINNIEETLKYDGKYYQVPANSVTLIDQNGTQLYNTATVNSTGLPTERVNTVLYSGSDLKFESYQEPIPLTDTNSKIRPDSGIMNKSPLEQIRLTNDTYEFVIYQTNVTLSNNIAEGAQLQFTGQAANAYMIFFNGNYIGQVADYEHTSKTLTMSVTLNVSMNKGDYALTVVSSSLGIDNYNGVAAGKTAAECDKKGLSGSVKLLDESKKVVQDLTDNGWIQYIGLTGEVLDIYGDGMNKVTWKSPPVVDSGMTWYKTTFNTPSQSVLDKGVILIDIGKDSNGLNRGHLFVNGQDLGHYNNVEQGGIMVQQFYFVPKDILTSNGGENTLVFVEEYPSTILSNINIVSSNVVVPPLTYS